MISYEVEFPTQKSFSLKIDGYSGSEGLDCKTIDAIGGDVKLQLDKKTMLTIPYREDITADFTLEGYTQRAKQHAEAIVSKLLEAANEQAACMQTSKNEVSVQLDSVNSVRLSAF